MSAASPRQYPLRIERKGAVLTDINILAVSSAERDGIERLVVVDFLSYLDA
jgi:hypothetical protein